MAFSQAGFQSALQPIAAKGPQQRAQEYLSAFRSLLHQPRSSLSSEQLLSASSHFLDTAVFSDLNASGGGLIVGRSTLSGFDDCIKEAISKSSTGGEAADAKDDASQPAVLDEEVRVQLYQNALDRIQPRLLSFEEQASAICLSLADAHEALQDWTAAAKALQEIPLDSGHRTVSSQIKLRIYMRIVRLLLEADDAISADAYLKRASMVVHTVPGTGVGGGIVSSDPSADADSAQASTSGSTQDVKEGKVLGLQYKLCQARIYDSQRRFSEAAVRFHDLSYVTDIDADERLMMLSAAVTAAILAPAGPQRSRVLGTLIRDERVSSLPQSTILSKVFLDQIIRPDEVASFEGMLQPHQRAQLARTGNEREMMRIEAEAEQQDPASTAAGSSTTASMDASPAPGPTAASAVAGLKSSPTTVLERAMMEHNILASSKLYISITLQGLGSMLSLTATGAETMVRRMIAQKRLKGEIDQVEGVLYFLESANEGPTAGGLGLTADDGETSGGNEANAAGPGDATGSGRAELAQLISPGSGDGLIKRWDAQIAKTASALEEACVRIAAMKAGA